MTNKEFWDAVVCSPLLKIAWVSLKRKGWKPVITYVGNDIDYWDNIGELIEEMRLIVCAIEKADDETKMMFDNYIKGNMK